MGARATSFAEIGPLGIAPLGRRLTTVQKRHELLLKAITSSFNKTECKRGSVYLWKHKTDPRLVKIGFTVRTIQERRSDSKNCYAKETDEFWESEEPFVGASRVEKIVKQHLREWNLPLRICKHCRKGHREWFEKSAEEVRALMQDWTRFARIGYSDGMLTEAGRRAVRARILDMRPNIPELVAFLVSNAASETISAVAGLASVSERGTAVIGDMSTHVSILVGDERTTITAEPDSWSIVSEDGISPGTMPRDRAAKSKWRSIDWKGKAKATCRLFCAPRSTRPEESGFPSGSGSGQRPDPGEGNENEMRQTLNSVLRRLSNLEKERGTNKQEDELALRRRIASWIPRSRRAATISIFAD
jgi:hypothetical protein